MAKSSLAKVKQLKKNAADDVRVVVVGNPCNTNCYIAMNSAPSIPKDRWFAMTKLDENRAKGQMAEKSGIAVKDIKKTTIWGNHSATQYPDFYNATIDGKPATKVITDEAWFKNDFIPRVQKRGAEIIKARGASSAASAANAVVDTVRCLTTPTQADDWHSVAVCSDGSYGTPEGLLVSLPIKSDGQNWEVVQGLEINDYSREKIDASCEELQQERDMVKELLEGAAVS